MLPLILIDNFIHFFQLFLIILKLFKKLGLFVLFLLELGLDVHFILDFFLEGDFFFEEGFFDSGLVFHGLVFFDFGLELLGFLGLVFEVLLF